MVIDWTKIAGKYKGMWVAFKDDHVSVVASGKTLKETMQKATKKGYKNAGYMRFPDELGAFAGTI